MKGGTSLLLRAAAGMRGGIGGGRISLGPPPPTPPVPSYPHPHPLAPTRHIRRKMASNKQSQRPRWFASLTYKPSLSICSLEARLMKGAMGRREEGGGL